MNNQLYDVEIVKALEYCAEDTRCVTDRKCPLVADEDCHTTLSRNALELIKRLQDEIENLLCKNAELEVRCEGILQDYYAQSKTCDEQRVKYERMLEDGEIVSKEWHDEQVLHAELVIEDQKAEIERLTEEIEQSKSMYDDIRKCNDILLKERADLQKQVDELKERKEFWEGMHDRVCAEVENLQDEIEGYDQKVFILRERLEQAVKDTAKEILRIVKEKDYDYLWSLEKLIKDHYGVEVD